MVEVNLDQLAKQLGCSLPTARKLVQDYSAMPVIERGGLGKQWRFDAAEVIAFLQAERDREEAEQAERNEALAQLTLPIIRRDEMGKKISLDDKLKAAKLRKIELDELKETRFLVPTLEVRTALERALRRWVQAESNVIERITKSHNLPDAVRRAMEREFNDARTAFVRDASEFLTNPEGGDEPISLFG